MYSFAQRSDTRVFDEPLYAHYLTRDEARLYHPGADQIIESMETDGEKVVREVLLGENDKPVLFFKNMTHHLIKLDWAFLEHLDNVLLTRNPREVVLSFSRNVLSPTLKDTGFAAQAELYKFLSSRRLGVPVLDAKEVLLNPERVLRQLCDRLEIPFEAEMLRWPAGPRPEDGVWAGHWYASVHQSCGFHPYRETDFELPDHLERLAEECRPSYEELRAVAIRA
jgi:hypothetical protein